MPTSYPKNVDLEEADDTKRKKALIRSFGYSNRFNIYRKPPIDLNIIYAVQEFKNKRGLGASTSFPRKDVVDLDDHFSNIEIKGKGKAANLDDLPFPNSSSKFFQLFNRVLKNGPK